MKRRIKAKSYRMPAAICPNCGKLNDAVTSFDLNGHQPLASRPGDVTICFGCAVYLVFTEDMGLRYLRDSEWMRLSAQQRADYSFARDTLKLSREGTEH